MVRLNGIGRSVRALLGVSLSLCALSAHAQQASTPAEEADDLENVVVTGSRIVRDGFQAPTPVSVLSAERLEQRAATNIGDALNELPAFRATQSPAAQGLGGGYVGGRVLDLRGLGTVRTLTLVDGKRFVPSTLQNTVDTNMIPSGLIERAEVVTGGASAAYGSDAVAGVVNFLINERLTGFRSSLSYGISQYSDDKTYAVSFSGGTSLFGGRGHFVAAADLEKNDGVGTCIVRDWCADEWLNFGRPTTADFATTGPQDTTGLAANNILPNVRPSTIAPGGVINNTALRGITFNPDGSGRQFVYGRSVNSLYMVGGEGDNVNGYFQGIPIKAATERLALYTRTRFDITDAVTARVDLSYGHLTGNHFGAETRNTLAPLNTTALTIFRDNPYLPRSSNPTYDIPSRMDAAGITSFQLGRHYGDYGNPAIESQVDVLRGVLSLSGPITEKWNWDAYYQYGNNHYANHTSNNVINARMAEAFRAVAGPNGLPACLINVDANPNNNNASCAPINPFGAQISRAAWEYVTGTSVQINRTEQHVFAGNVNGDLLNLWAGPLSIASGLEYRSDRITGDADPISRSLGFIGSNGSAVSGVIDVAEGYVETNLPLAKEVLLAKDLQVNGAIRRTRYDREGAGASSKVYATTWKYGATWTPIDLLRFRATKSRDIRAPNVSELFGPTTLGGAILNDPFRGGAQTAPRAINGSNPQLLPEEADTTTIGVVIQPQADGMLGRLQASVDYYKIKIDDAIGVLGGQTIVTRCFQGASEFCPLIQRDATGVISLITDVQQNVNQLITSGLDIEISYRQPTAIGDFDLRLLGTVVNELTTVDSGGPLDRAGQTGLRGGTIPGLPDYTIDGLLTYRRGGLQTSLHTRYIPSGFYNVSFVGPGDAGFSLANPASSNLNDVPAAMYYDINGQYDFSGEGDGGLVVFAAINNATDKDPPRRPGANGSGNNVLFDAVGRVYRVGVRFKL